MQAHRISTETKLHEDSPQAIALGTITVAICSRRDRSGVQRLVGGVAKFRPDHSAR